MLAIFVKKYIQCRWYPRNENPNKLRNERIKRINLKFGKVKEISGRKKAIIHALKNSDPHEIILIAGKGHETYQDLGKNKIYFSDKKIIHKFKMKKISIKKNNLKHNSIVLRKILKSNSDYMFDGVSINSKKTSNKNLFVAIKGKSKDGHNFLNEAIKNGASYCVVSKNSKNKYRPIKVKNTLNFLKILGSEKRNLSSAKFIAVTGSTGKTTVKTMLGNLLKKYSSTYFSPQSYNNHYGVPLSLSNILPDHNFGVFEVGMSNFNEIFKLSNMVKPQIGIITNISEAHLENFKSINDIAKAKSEIIYNIKKGGTIILNRDDKFFNYFRKIGKKNNIKIRFLDIKKSDVFFKV